MLFPLKPSKPFSRVTFSGPSSCLPSYSHLSIWAFCLHSLADEMLMSRAVLSSHTGSGPCNSRVTNPTKMWMAPSAGVQTASGCLVL